MAISNFSPSGYGSIVAQSGVSAAQALPGGGGATLIVTNIGPFAAVVLLGSSSVSVTPSTGIAISPNQSVPLAVGSATFIAAMGVQGVSVLNLTQGT